MAAPGENRFFLPEPYYIPGYEGFVPQYNYQFGETFGRTTYKLLTDPGVRKSPRPVLAPLHKQKFVEDFSGTKHGVQGYLPGRPGYLPYEKAEAATTFPEPDPGPKPPLLVPGLEEAELCKAREKQEWPSPFPGSGRDFSNEAKGGSRFYWSLFYFCFYFEPVKIEGVTLPGVAETADVEQDNRLPKLDVPNVIQQKVIPGYAGFIPRLTWIHGVNYMQGVKEAMNEFERHQFLQRNPVCGFGKRFPQTHWPNYRIYTSAGLIPSYMGFVPDLRHTYALTFGNGTRKAYQKEQRRRACAL
ncbi:ciliary microtubule inner protein 2A [Alca torda]